MAVETVIIDVDLNASDAIAEGNKLGVTLTNLKARQKELRDQGQANSVEYARNATEIRALSKEQKAYITVADAAKGSNNQLRAQLSLLTAQYNAMSAEERDNTDAGKYLTLQTKALSDELKRTEGNVGDTRRSVADYTNSIKAALGNSIPFSDEIDKLAGLFDTFGASVTSVKEAIEAQRIATELSTAAATKSAAAIEANAAATEASVTATIANTEATEAQVAAETLRIEADRQRVVIENQLIATEQREIAIQAQLVAENAAIVAEETLRIAEEQALVATQAELVAVEEARVAAEAEVAAATTATAAATQASAAKQTALAGAFRAGGAVILAVLLAVGAAVYSFLARLDSVSDGIDQFKAKAIGSFGELGHQITSAFEKGGFLSSIKAIFSQSTREATAAAGKIAGAFEDAFQQLGDRTDVNEIANQVTQNQVANLRIRARNRSLSNAEQQKLLNEADQLEQTQFNNTKKLHTDIIAESVAFANQSLDIRGTLNEKQKQQLRDGDIALANSLLNQDKISRDAYKKLQEAYSKRNADVQQSNSQLEKIQNDQDKYAEQEKARQEKRTEELNKINEDRAKSELATASLLLTKREKEYADIDLDINKRIELYRKYGQSTEQLEKERQARQTILTQKFQSEDLNTIRNNINEAANLRIQGITDSALRQQAQQEQANQVAIQNVDTQILAIASRIALGEQGLTDLLQSFVDKRNAIVQVGNEQRAINEQANIDRLAALEQAGLAASVEAQTQDLLFQEQGKEARLRINNEIAGSVGDVFGTVADLAGKTTAIGKIALVAQKGFAIAQILINAELAKSAIIAKYANLEYQASFIPFAGPFIIAGLEAAKFVEIGAVTLNSIISAGLVAAQTVASLVSGKAKGGVHYESDGKGALLRGPGTGTSDSMNARLSNGEVVINARSSQLFKPLLSDINVAGGGVAFARGGQFGGTYVSSLAGQVNQQAALRDAVMAGVAGLKVITLVQDINTAQDKQAQIEADATF
jgi:hypothetical protein